MLLAFPVALLVAWGSCVFVLQRHLFLVSQVAQVEKTALKLAINDLPVKEAVQ